MKSFVIKKSDLQGNFTGIYTPDLGIAAGCLKLCGLKLYLYLAGNKDKMTWVMNPSAFASYLGLDYKNASQARSVRKTIQEGIEDLIENGYLELVNEDLYNFSEQKVPKKGG